MNGEWILPLNDLVSPAFQSVLSLASLASRFSFIHPLQGSDLRLVAWLALLSLSACGLNSASNEIYLMACDCGKCLVLKGFAAWQA